MSNDRSPLPAAAPSLPTDHLPRVPQRELDAIVQQLAEEYDATPEAVRQLIDGVLATFADARVREFVPVLLEKEARELLRRGASPQLSFARHRLDT